MADIDHHRIDVGFVPKADLTNVLARAAPLPEQHEEECRDQHSQPDKREHDEDRVAAHPRA